MKKNEKKGPNLLKDLDFKKMEVLPVAAVDNCYSCDCGDGSDSGDGSSCDCVSCDSG